MSLGEKKYIKVGILNLNLVWGAKNNLKRLLYFFFGENFGPGSNGFENFLENSICNLHHISTLCHYVDIHESFFSCNFKFGK